MHNTALYRENLFLYIIVVCFIALLLFIIANIVLFILKKTNVFYEKKVSAMVNIVGLLIIFVAIIPALLDIQQSSYCEITNVVHIKTELKTKYSKYVLITDGNGAVYTCYDSLIDTESLEGISYPITVVYAKHSKLMLDYYTFTPSN